MHLAAVISTWVSNRLAADGITGRDLLGCAVAAAVSASFNAPIAGALFALEVVLRHFAVHAFAPIVIASVAGTVINRLAFGDITEFSLGEASVLAFYVELPAFLILGLLSGGVAVLMMRAIFWADDFGSYFQRRVGLPRVLRPAVAGALLGWLGDLLPAYHWGWIRDNFSGFNRLIDAARSGRFLCAEGCCRRHHHGRPHGRRRVFTLAHGWGFAWVGVWTCGDGHCAEHFRFGNALRAGGHGRGCGSRFGRAHFNDAYCVRADGRLANGSGGDGGGFDVDGFGVTPCGPFILLIATGATQYSPCRRAAGLSSVYVPGGQRYAHA